MHCSGFLNATVSVIWWSFDLFYTAFLDFLHDILTPLLFCSKQAAHSKSQ